MSVKVYDLKLNGPAFQAGLRVGDRIADIDGYRIDEPQDIAFALRSIRPTDEVAIRVRRGSNWSRRTFTLTGIGRVSSKKKTRRLGVITDPSLAGNFYRRSALGRRS